jgi:ketosteroid isomerase-like protein
MYRTWQLAAAIGLTFGMAGNVEAATTAAPPPPAATAKPPPKAAGPSDRAQIQALEKGFIAGFDAKNVDKIMSYYARDGLFVYDVSPPREYVGWAAYKKDWEELFAGFPGPASADLSELSFTVVGPVAYGHSIQDAHFTAKDGAKVELVVRVTDVYRKLAGKWRIVQEHVSVPVDLDTGKPDLLSKP